ncbi:hypothetical protein CYMTET_12453 [Cymbomonas tetramitiformis]|uniref:Uncharacterized protein n=1 Tax=Cymbomonas tetramitiformis TaxID=36881 RepID=A0AAE0GK10_9CHLO|nr:hypothetical protein CYMTET_12453 [Cymbomonas tetramitiformis]|eukprot:gene11440-13521_t
MCVCACYLSDASLDLRTAWRFQVGFSPAQTEQLAASEEQLNQAKAALVRARCPPPPTPPPPTPGSKKKGKQEEEPEPIEPDPEQIREAEEALEVAQTNYDTLKGQFETDNLTFTVVDLKRVTDYMTSSFFKHLRLYQYVFCKDQEHAKDNVTVKVETAVPALPLRMALSPEELEMHKQSLAAEAKAEEEARIKREEEDKQKAEEEHIEAERVRKEEEEAELRKRKPGTLDEAVDHAIMMRLLEEKEKLEAEYKAREEQLMEKIRTIESRLAPA